VCVCVSGRTTTGGGGRVEHGCCLCVRVCLVGLRLVVEVVWNMAVVCVCVCVW